MEESPVAHSSLNRLASAAKDAGAAVQTLVKSRQKLISSGLDAAKAKHALASSFNAAPFCKDGAEQIGDALLQVASLLESLYTSPAAEDSNKPV